MFYSFCLCVFVLFRCTIYVWVFFLLATDLASVLYTCTVHVFSCTCTLYRYYSNVHMCTHTVVGSVGVSREAWPRPLSRTHQRRCVITSIRSVVLNCPTLSRDVPHNLTYIPWLCIQPHGCILPHECNRGYVKKANTLIHLYTVYHKTLFCVLCIKFLQHVYCTKS